MAGCEYSNYPPDFFTIGAGGITFLYGQFIIPGKEAEIGALERQNENLKTELENKEKETPLPQPAQVDKSSTLKQRAKILAIQLEEFAIATQTTASKMSPSQSQFLYDREWHTRFQTRIKAISEELDEQGQFSDELMIGLTDNRPSCRDLQTLSATIAKLADDLSGPEIQ